MKYFICILLGFQISFVCAQRNCGSADYWKQQLQNDVTLSKRYTKIETASRYRASMKVQHPEVDDGTVITIPVVIHILYNTSAQNISDAQIETQLDVLNKDFQKRNEDVGKVPVAFSEYAADCQIKFVLARLDPQGRSTSGIVRRKTAQVSWKQDDKMKYSVNEGDDAWDSRYYLNIWVCNLGDGLLGYSTFPGAAPDKDGVVIRTDVFGTGNINSVYNKGRTATHEIGHWLNLKHLWGDTECGSDDVDDTPPQKTYSSGCSSFPKITAGGCNKNPNGDMFMNFMDFSDDECILMFTYGQRQRMRDIFTPNGPRASMRNSPALKAVTENAETETDKKSGNTLSLFVYPNPSSNSIHFRNFNGNNIIPEYFNVFDSKGQSLMSGSNKQFINITRLMQGIYFIRIQYEGKDTVIRFMKK
ncbi:MAG: T9SS type A sorting domain-containing protein [Bacteroidetes bacterium]|nr:T9SS type A sorting domain-containing protein [Bacteroidota bacterium]